MMVSAWCHERHHRVSAKQWPFRLAKLGDHRLPESTRLQEARTLKGKKTLLRAVGYGEDAATQAVGAEFGLADLLPFLLQGLQCV